MGIPILIVFSQLVVPVAGKEELAVEKFYESSYNFSIFIFIKGGKRILRYSVCLNEPMA